MKYSANSVWENKDEYDVYVVVGAGHAGCEAALACARLGLETVMFTVSVDSIAMMPCNPNIGGSSKGHLVRELDALGGEMGKIIDKTFIQSKMLNKSKGPAVHSLRAQADKANYRRKTFGKPGESDHQTGRSHRDSRGRWQNYRSTDFIQVHISLPGSCTLYRNIPEGKMYLR